MNSIFKLLVTAAIAFLLAKILPGITINSYFTALCVVFVLSILNTILKPILVFLTFPVTLVTFGLFLLVINAGIIMLDDSFVHGFSVASFWYALLFSLCLSACESFVSSFLFNNDKEKKSN